jgi:hypothetical protein
MVTPFMKTHLLASCILAASLSPFAGSAQTNWSLRLSNTTQPLAQVGYGGGTFVATGSGIVLNSTNGLSWTPYNLGSTSVTSLAYYNGVWYGLGAFGGPNFGTSTNNGHTWTGRNIVGLSARAIACASGTLVAVGDSGFIRYSTDGGLTWNIGLSPTSNPIYGAAYGNGTWVAVGTYGTTITSSDAQLWTLQSPADAWVPRSLTYAGGVFVMDADDSSLGSKLLVSNNAGINWITATSPPAQYVSADHVGYGDGTWVAVGLVGRVLLSADAGRTWALQNSGITTDLSAVTYGSGIWVAVGNNGTIITSQASGSAEPPLVPNLQIQRAIELNWQSQEDALYQVQCSTNAAFWQNIGSPILGDGQPKNFYDAASQNPSKLYRVQVK